MKKPQFKRMFETKSMRPYYSVPHIAIAGKLFEALVGIQYRVLDVTSANMSNEGYAEVSDMDKATKYFSHFWENQIKVNALLKNVKKYYKKALQAETYGHLQNWKKKNIRELTRDMNLFYELMTAIMVRTIISQPQHVLPLDQKINDLLGSHPNKDQLLLSATYFEGNLPWVEENLIIAELKSKWSSFSDQEKLEKLEYLVKKFGWFNDIEGDESFDLDHYKQKIEEFEPEVIKETPLIKVPRKVRKIGKLIGELGFLRFWARHHFMSLRYHLKKIIQELVTRYNLPELEFATVEEINKFLDGEKLNWTEIKARRNGYVTFLYNGKAKIVTGAKAEKLKKLVMEKQVKVNIIKGVAASKGKVVGKVRIISFTAEDYHKQVASFEKGEILVTGMTRPQIIHLCHKAAGIITDEGGITSHAAVVGREFGIPCVIATHNATRLLKTGDLVELDADKGEVVVL